VRVNSIGHDRHAPHRLHVWRRFALFSLQALLAAGSMPWWSRTDGQTGSQPPVTPAKAIVTPLTTAITTHAWNGNFVRAPRA
jgi:hypothetical protein